MHTSSGSAESRSPSAMCSGRFAAGDLAGVPRRLGVASWLMPLPLGSVMTIVAIPADTSFTLVSKVVEGACAPTSAGRKEDAMVSRMTAFASSARRRTQKPASAMNWLCPTRGGKRRVEERWPPTHVWHLCCTRRRRSRPLLLLPRAGARSLWPVSCGWKREAVVG